MTRSHFGLEVISHAKCRDNRVKEYGRLCYFGLTQIFIQNVGSVEGKGDAFQIGEDGQLALGDRHLLGSASYPKGLKVKSFTLRYDASTDIFSVTLEIGDRSRQTLSRTSFEVKRINRTVT